MFGNHTWVSEILWKYQTNENKLDLKIQLQYAVYIPLGAGLMSTKEDMSQNGHALH